MSVTDGSNSFFAVTRYCECCVSHTKTLNVSKFSNQPHHSNIWLHRKSLSSGITAVNKKSSRGRAAAAASLCCAPSLHCYHRYCLLPKANSTWRDRVSSAIKDVASVDANINTHRCKDLFTGPGATVKLGYYLIILVGLAIVDWKQKTRTKIISPPQDNIFAWHLTFIIINKYNLCFSMSILQMFSQTLFIFRLSVSCLGKSIVAMVLTGFWYFIYFTYLSGM